MKDDHTFADKHPSESFKEVLEETLKEGAQKLLQKAIEVEVQEFMALFETNMNNYEEASIFLEEKSNCDEDNIYKDRFLYLLGANYFYGMNNRERAITSLTKILDNFPNSIYYNKARQIISEINLEVNNSI